MATHEVLHFDNQFEAKSKIELHNFEFKSSVNLRIEDLNLGIKAKDTKEDAVLGVVDAPLSMQLFNSKFKQLKFEGQFEVIEAKKLKSIEAS